MEEVRKVGASYETLANLLDHPPYDPDNFGLPDDLHDLNNAELNDFLYRAGRMYAHYVNVESNLGAINKGLKEAMKILAASLRQHLYSDLAKDVQKDYVLMDKDYTEAFRISRDLEYVYGEAEGGKKFWSSMKDTLSRSVELRKDVGRPSNPMERSAKNPKKPRRIKTNFGPAEEDA